MSLATKLWKANGDWAGKILAHRFVQGLGNGALPVASFKGYVAQEFVPARPDVIASLRQGVRICDV